MHVLQSFANALKEPKGAKLLAAILFTAINQTKQQPGLCKAALVCCHALLT